MKKNIYIAPSVSLRELNVECMFVDASIPRSASTTNENMPTNLSGNLYEGHIGTGNGTGINSAKEGGLSDWDDL